MATVARGTITLMNVNDACLVSLTPNTCTVKADFDGTNPALDNTYCDITVIRGDKKVSFTIKSVTPSNSNILYSISGDNYSKRLAITSIPSDILTGTVTVEIEAENNFVSKAIFQYSVIREASMLDWIQDWDTNKTSIGSTYLITPKLFVGKKIENEAGLSTMTGVYIGPDNNRGAGVYGYKEGQDIFHINEDGGFIGGWQINKDGIHTLDGALKILAEGTIISLGTKGQPVWHLTKAGEAVFAGGRVQFHANGDAEFDGTITSRDGLIGGWTIAADVLKSQSICLDSFQNYIGIAATSQGTATEWAGEEHKSWVTQYGGVYMYYTNSSSYGFAGYLPQGEKDDEPQQRKVFSLGSENLIAGWKFDDSAIWLGTKQNTSQQYTGETGSVTIGTNGLRGHQWYIDSNGDMSFMGGKMKFSSANGGELVGWKLNDTRLSTDHAALVSSDFLTGLYLSAYPDAKFNSLASASIKSYIETNGGLYINVGTASAVLAAYNNNAKTLFKLSSGETSLIASWNFDNEAIYIGTKAATADFTSNATSMTLSSKGLMGYKWKLMQDGSGAIAGGNISWDAEGNVTFGESVSLSWSQGISEAKSAANSASSAAKSAAIVANKADSTASTASTTAYSALTTASNAIDNANQAVSAAMGVQQHINDEVTPRVTYITKEGIVTGFISADNITAGTISTADIKQKDGAWELSQDGSGKLADGNITWDKYGGCVLGGFEIAEKRIGVVDSAEGLHIGPEFIQYKITDTTHLAKPTKIARIGLNTLTSSYPCLACFEYSDESSSSTATNCIGIHVKVQPKSTGWAYKQRAIEAWGNIFSIGGRAHFSNQYIGVATGSNMITNYLGITHNFHFLKNTSSSANITMYLPTKSSVVDKIGTTENVMFDLKITCHHDMNYKIILTSQTGAEMYNNEGKGVSSQTLNNGDAIELRYYDGYYLITSTNY